MSSYVTSLMQKYKYKGLLIDTNVFLLYIIGSIDITFVRGFARTANRYNEQDFLLVSKFIEYFEIKVTTPHILTEVSNLMGNRADFQIALQVLLKGQLNEKFLASAQIAQAESFMKFGLTDSAISESARDSHLVFTDDNPLYGYLINNGIEAVNLEQIKNA